MAFKTWSVGDVLTAADVNTYLGKQSVIVCTSGTRPSSPVEGMTIYETDTDRVLIYTGSAWSIWPPQVVEVEESTLVTTTSATFAAGSPACATTFTAPPSGRATVYLAGDVEGGGTTVEGQLTFEIRLTDSVGAVHTSATKHNGVSTQGPANVIAGNGGKLITGLTAGSTYYVQAMHATGTGGTLISVYYRRLLIVPQAS